MKSVFWRFVIDYAELCAYFISIFFGRNHFLNSWSGRYLVDTFK